MTTICFASDINDLITTLDLRDVTLVGFSMGGGDVTRLSTTTAANAWPVLPCWAR